MLAFTLRRVLLTVPILLVVVSLLFALMEGIGGDPLRLGQLAGISSVAWVKSGDAKPESIERNMRRARSLDRPWHERYASYLRAVATWDFGHTFSYRYLTVNDILARQAPVSLLLGLLALLWAVALGLPAGRRVRAARRERGRRRRAHRHDARVRRAELPRRHAADLRAGRPLAGRADERLERVAGEGAAVVHVRAAAGRLRCAARARLDARDAAPGARPRRDREGPAAGGDRRRPRAAQLARTGRDGPGPLLGYLVTGSFVVERIFAVPGIGRYYIAGVLARDYPLVLGLTVVLTIAIVLANLLVDLVHAGLDPRVRESWA